MVLFTILLIAIFVALSLTVFIIGTFGGIFLFVFGDIIVCIALIVLMLKWLTCRKK